MVLKYKFIDDHGNLKIKSNLMSNGLDILDILGSDICDEYSLNEFFKHISRKERWWSNATRVEFNNDKATIYPAFQWEEEGQPETKGIIEIKTLKKTMKEWVEFLKNE